MRAFGRPPDAWGSIWIFIIAWIADRLFDRSSVIPYQRTKVKESDEPILPKLHLSRIGRSLRVLQMGYFLLLMVWLEFDLVAVVKVYVGTLIVVPAAAIVVGVLVLEVVIAWIFRRLWPQQPQQQQRP